MKAVIIAVLLIVGCKPTEPPGRQQSAGVDPTFMELIRPKPKWNDPESRVRRQQFEIQQLRSDIDELRSQRRREQKAAEWQKTIQNLSRTSGGG